MADLLTLVRTYDFASDQGTVSLVTGADGFEAAYQGWTPKGIPNNDGIIREAITLRASGASIDALATSVQKIADKAREAAQFFEDASEPYAVFLRVQLDGESKARQSLVYNIEHQAASSVYDATFKSRYHLNEYSVGIERAPWWEATEAGTITQGSVIALGGTFAFGAINGDLPARLARLRLSSSASATNGSIFPYGKAWVGFRSNRFGTATSFVPYWDLAHVNWGASGTAVANSLARTGTALQWAGTPSWTLVGGMQLDDLTATPGNLRGEFLFLLRACVAGSATYSVRMTTRWSWEGTADAQVFPRARFASTGGSIFAIEEMGIVNIPHGRSIASAIQSGDIGGYTVELLANRESGTAKILFDSFYLIPTEGMASIESSNLAGINTGSSSAFLVNGPHGEVEGAMLDDSTAPQLYPQTVGAPLVYKGIPPGDGGIVVVVATNYNGAINDKNVVTATINYYARWQGLRGND